MRSSGSLGFEMYGSRSTTIGLGSDPARATQDVATPTARLRWRLAAPASGTSLTLNLAASYRSGPQGLFGRETALRASDVHLDQDFGRMLRFSLGRFMSTFDHASGYWDGGMVRIGSDRGLRVGLAGGFEPLRGNEEFSSRRPKAAVFAGLRTGRGSVRYSADASAFRVFPRDSTPRVTIADWSHRLDAGSVRLGQDLEASLDPSTSTWSVRRVQARLSASLTRREEIYAAWVRDRPPVLDPIPGLPPGWRERVNGGIGHRSGRVYGNVDLSVTEPGDRRRGYGVGVTLGFPALAAGISPSVSGNYYTLPSGRGVMAGPSLEARIGGVRARLGYQFYRTDAPLYSSTAHGGDLMVSRTIAGRFDWVTRVSFRDGANVRTAGAYTSLDVRF
jgi:hypothetical protein